MNILHIMQSKSNEFVIIAQQNGKANEWIVNIYWHLVHGI